MALKALCIGINDYPGTGSDLHGCVNDAHDWAAELRRRGFDVNLLLDRAATGAEMRLRIRGLIEAAASGDTLVVQFSGHGSFVPDRDGDEPDGADECLCPSDLHRGYITDDELFELFSAKAAGVELVMISDSCHSGTVARFAPGTTPSAVPGRSEGERRVRFLPPASFLATPGLERLGARHAVRNRAAPGRHAALTLAGCRDAEFSYDACFNGRANGAFTYVALDVLKGLPAGATYRQWYDAIRRRLPSSEYPQTPSLYGPRARKDRPVFLANSSQ